MAQPVTPQEHVTRAAARVKAQRDAARQLAVDLAAQRAPVAGDTPSPATGSAG